MPDVIQQISGGVCMRIDSLYGGGVIVNYHCSSRCAHCINASSPTWPKDYMDAATADRVCATLARLGCHCVHIGGGEPLLNPEGLYAVLEAARTHRITIDYVETNASWHQPERPERTQSILRRMMSLGVDMLLISISPYHNAYIPYRKVLDLVAMCREVGMTSFPYQRQFISDIAAFDVTRPHGLDEYQQKYGPSYLKDSFRRFGVGLGGRAVAVAAQFMQKHPAEAWLDTSPCHSLCQTHHFHLDLYGRYVPGGCPGMGFDIDDLGTPLSPERYPIAAAAYDKGVAGVCEIALREGFAPDPEGYIDSCHLCLAARTFLCATGNYDELTPAAYYTEAWRLD